jgi:tRNA (guanine-N7-)-methyltransferase
MEWPTSWKNMYGRNASLLLEIGFGTGHLLIDWAKSRPDSNVLGMEISLPSLRRGEKKMQVANLSNLRILQADSRTALWLLFAPRTISEVVINFPDPWPKANHHHRRIINDNFLHLLGTRVQEGALLDIATDHEDYAGVIAGCLANSPFFDNRLKVPFLVEDHSRLQTKYEKIALSEGRICHYFKYRRNSNIAPDLFLIPEVSEVPHVVLSFPIQLGEISRQFKPYFVQAENSTIKYLDTFRSTKEGLLLVEVYVSEEPYHQRICLSIRLRESGDVVVSLYPVGFPRPTPGLHLAIFHFVQWLQTVDPEITVVTSTLNVTDEAY